LYLAQKNRRRWLQKDICEELYPYINKILENQKCYSYQIGGITDHIHIACGLCDEPGETSSSIDVSGGIYSVITKK
jgi:hypothetical protein